MTGPVDEFFADDRTALCIHARLLSELTAVGGVEVGVSRSQVAYRLGRTFAVEWRPGRYLRSDVPLVLSLALRERLDSARFKQVVQVPGGTWMHHLELRAPAEVDDEVRGWIRLAREQAQERRG